MTTLGYVGMCLDIGTEIIDILMKFSSMALPGVVILATSRATKMTTVSVLLQNE